MENELQQSDVLSVQEGFSKVSVGEGHTINIEKEPVNIVFIGHVGTLRQREKNRIECTSSSSLFLFIYY